MGITEHTVRRDIARLRDLGYDVGRWGSYRFAQAISAHRAWFAALLMDLLAELGIDNGPDVADRLVVLRDSAMVGGCIGSTSEVRAARSSAPGVR